MNKITLTKKIIALTLVIFSGLIIQAQTGFAQTTDGLSAAELLKRAKDAENNKDTVAQEKYLTAAIKTDPKNIDAYEQRAMMYEAADKIDLALADYRQMLEFDPQNPEIYFLRASLYKNKKDYARAVSDFTTLLGFKINPRQSAMVYYERGVAYHKIYDYDKAVADLSKALELQPNYKGALAERGEIYTFQGNYDFAETDLKKLLKLEPENKLAAEDLELLKAMKKAGFNTGKTKEDTLLKFDEYSDQIMSEYEVYKQKSELLSSAIAQNRNDIPKICSAVGNADLSLKKIESSAAKINQLLTDGKFDKVPSLKDAAQQMVGLFPEDRATINKSASTYGCKLN